MLRVSPDSITNDSGQMTAVFVSLVKYVGGDFSIKHRVRAYDDESGGTESQQVCVARIGAPGVVGPGK